ncbi:unnamed protein product, partial [Ostreobium quekettii]
QRREQGNLDRRSRWVSGAPKHVLVGDDAGGRCSDGTVAPPFHGLTHGLVDHERWKGLDDVAGRPGGGGAAARAGDVAAGRGAGPGKGRMM